jgi:CHRD domain
MYRVSVLIVGLGIFLAGCGGDSSPNAPSQGTTTTSTFTVPLTPAKEVPVITNADASGSGTAVIALTVVKDGAGNITSASANFQISVTGFPAGTRVTDAHIHGAAAGSNGGAIVNVGLTSGELAITNGSGSITKNGINVPADRAAAILNNRAAHYFNVHTALNPDGAIRGQLSEGTFDPGTVVPY